MLFRSSIGLAMVRSVSKPSPVPRIVTSPKSSARPRKIDLDALDLVHVHLVGLPPDEALLVDDSPVGDRDLSDPPPQPLLEQENDRNECEGVCHIPPDPREEPGFAKPVSDHR